MRRLLGLLVLSLLAAVLAPGLASASTLPECQAKLDALVVQTDAAAFTGPKAETDRAGLLVKLADARAKLGEGKVADATVKLVQFRDKVAALAAAGKLDAAAASELQAGADDALACFAALGT